jgi:hypothetical protein
MKKNGFVFVETIVSIIILTTALILLYSSFHRILQNEKTRVYYDDFNYIYRSWYIREELEEVGLGSFVNDFNLEMENDTSRVKSGIKVIGQSNLLKIDSVSTDDETKEKIGFVTNMMNDFDAVTNILLYTGKLSDIKSCIPRSGDFSKFPTDTRCQEIAKLPLSQAFLLYIRSIYIEDGLQTTDILVSEYESCTSNNVCRNYYSWVSVKA